MAIDPATGQEIVEPTNGLLEQPSEIAPVSTQPQPTSILAEDTTPSNQYVSPQSLISNQLNTLLGKGSPLLDLAANRAKEESNRKGLLSSSMAVGAGQKAVLDTALPIASADANKFGQSDISRQVAEQNLNLTERQSELMSKQSAQDAAEAVDLQNITDTAAGARTAVQVQAELDKTSANIAAGDRADYGKTSGAITQQFIQAFQGIQTTSNEILSPAEKNLRLAELKNQTINDLNMQASIFGFEQEWITPE